MRCARPCLRNRVKRGVGVVIEIQDAAKRIGNRQDVAGTVVESR